MKSLLPAIRKTILSILLTVGACAYAGDVMIIDLNNSTEEVNHCEVGMNEANKKNGTTDKRIHAPGRPTLVKQRDGTMKEVKVVDPAYVEQKIAEAEAAGRSIDSIVISGHDGSGNFFGENGGIRASQLGAIIARHPKTKESLTGMALWGCYTTNANSCANYWMANISPNIKSTLGFTLQSPDNKQQWNWDLLQDYCMKRKDVADAQTAAEMNEILWRLKGVTADNALNIGICYQNGVCSDDYANVGEKGGACYHTYKELEERCSKFDPSRKLLETFKAYYAAKDPRYTNPPPDGENEFMNKVKTKKQKGELRRYYNQLHLWYQCSGQLIRETGYEMPMPAQVVRLTKFDTLKRNFERLHAPELKEYNDRLRALGMDELVLEPSKMSRAEIVDATEKAVVKFKTMTDAGGADVVGVNPWKMAVMAIGFDNSLRILQPDCTPFSYVHENASLHSNCVTKYGEYPIYGPKEGK